MSFYRQMLVVAVIAIALPFGFVIWMYPFLAVVLVIIVVHFRKKKDRLTTLGSARWAGAEDLRRAKMLDADGGLILGRVTDSPRTIGHAIKALFSRRLDAETACKEFLAMFRQPEPKLVKLRNAVHTAVFAPTGVGKGVSFVVPFLQTCPDSCVVVDFKGELATLTADHRRKMFGHKVVILDPFKVVTQTPDKLNPLDGIDKSNPLAIDDCRALAEALVIRTGQEKDPHWVDSAETWIAAMLAVTVYYGEADDKSLQTVRTLLSNPLKMAAVIKLMCESRDAWSGMLARMGFQLTHYQERELNGCITTVNRFLRFLDTIAVAESTNGSSFNPEELRNGKLTVFLVLPPEHMRVQSPLLRMWIGSMLRAVVRGGLQETNKVHFVLDEAASLGHLECLDDAVDKYRGYGVRLQFYYQSFSQLYLCWPQGRHQTLLSNTSQVFFGVNDPQTAQFVSARLGEETVVVGSGSSGTSKSVQSPSGAGQGSSSYSENQNSGWGQQVRRLLKPEEVEGLSPRIAITFTPGVPPLWTTLLRYYEESFGPPSAADRRQAQARIKRGCVAMLAAAILLSLGTMTLLHQYSGSHRRAVLQRRAVSREALRYTVDEFDRDGNPTQPGHMRRGQTSVPLVSQPSGAQRSRGSERDGRKWNHSRTDAAPSATNLRAAKQ